MHAEKKNPISDPSAQRQLLREQFVAGFGWKDAKLEPMQADASFRRYYRVLGAPRPLLLMQDPPDRPPVPPYVMVEPFIKIANHLRALGLRTPEIVASDIPNGLLLIEDFGDETYTRLFAAGADPKPLFELAVDALAHLHKHPKRNDIDLPPFSADILLDGAMLLLDWYLPALTGKTPTAAMKESYSKIWRDLFAKLPEDQKTLVLRDYHVDNIMLVKDAEGLARCGLLDFQDAAIGQFSYDLMSLLEDARRAMPEDLQKHLYERYMSALGTIDRKAFEYSFRVLAAQRHARVMGVFVRLCVRDGKDRYLQFIPHVRGLFLKALNDPALAPLRTWLEEQKIDLTDPLSIKDKTL